MLVRAYTYIRSHGAEGLRDVSEQAVINANYVMRRLAEHYRSALRSPLHARVRPVGQPPEASRACGRWTSPSGLLDFGVHAPTIYFPLIVDEAIMIEPTETESKETLDEFVDIMMQIVREIEEDPDVARNAPA